jgi:outer membrane biosynthesis protein TonB
VFPRAARPEGPERLHALRPAATGRRALTLRLGALLLVALLAAVGSGCGGDEEPAAQTPRALPDLTVPQTDEAPAPDPATETVAPAPSEPEPAPEPVPEAVPPSTDGGTPAPAPAPPADTPENDTPPPPDSPAERFEDFCNENPGACG